MELNQRKSSGLNCYNFEPLIGFNVGDNSQTDLFCYLAITDNGHESFYDLWNFFVVLTDSDEGLLGPM